MKWSDNQERIFDFVQNGDGNGIVKAVAGSGKTTTICEAARRIEFEMPDNIYLAFNKSIAEELKSRNVNGKTFHSLCLRPVLNHIGCREIDKNKTFSIINSLMDYGDRRIYGYFVKRLVSLAKQKAVGLDCKINPLQFYEIINHHDLELEDPDATIEEAVSIATEVLRISNKGESADFDDLLYYPDLFDIYLMPYELVFLDEAQDTNLIQRMILKRLMKDEGSRLMAVGDPHQAIYGFRGADSESMNIIQKEFKCESLDLTTSYRCPKKVVEFSQQWVNHIKPHELAEDGEVNNVKYRWKLDDFSNGDMVVCRTKKPLIALALKMLRSKSITPQVMGSEIGQSLKSLIRKIKGSNLEEFKTKLHAWFIRETDKAEERGDRTQMDMLEDKYLCIAELCNHEGVKSREDIFDLIDDLFASHREKVTLSTVHKAKGLEADNVYWLNSSECPSQRAVKPWEKQQELNICYVAATRAKKKLILIED